MLAFSAGSACSRRGVPLSIQYDGASDPGRPDWEPELAWSLPAGAHVQAISAQEASRGSTSISCPPALDGTVTEALEQELNA